MKTILIFQIFTCLTILNLTASSKDVNEPKINKLDRQFNGDSVLNAKTNKNGLKNQNSFDQSDADVEPLVQEDKNSNTISCLM